jgi:hypothetical protein
VTAATDAESISYTPPPVEDGGRGGPPIRLGYGELCVIFRTAVIAHDCHGGLE